VKPVITFSRRSLHPRVTPGPGDMDPLGQGPHGQPAVLPEFRQDPAVGLVQRDNLSSRDRFDRFRESHLAIILRQMSHNFQSLLFILDI
jgi:hypothetical protein